MRALVAVALLAAALPASAQRRRPFEPARCTPTPEKPHPAPLLVSRHAGRLFVERGTYGGGIGFGFAIPDPVPWRPLDRATQIADAPPLDAPKQLTLVGPGLTRVVDVRKQVLLSRGHWGLPVVAFELDAPPPGVAGALWGAHPQAAWLALAPRPATDDDAAWLAARRLPVYAIRSLLSIRTVAGTRDEIITAVPAQGSTGFAIARRDRAPLFSFHGTAHGAVRVGDTAWLVASSPHGVDVGEL